MAMLDDRVLDDMQQWLERAVLGLNLCPFARAVHAAGRIRWSVSAALEQEELLTDLGREIELLLAADPADIETTVLVCPHMLADFLDFNQFLDEAEDLLKRHHLEGTLQLASFHPQYQFADTLPDDIGNYSNRAPYPALHLLREASIDRAVRVMPDTMRIVENNLQTLEALGLAGWRRLWD